MSIASTELWRWLCLICTILSLIGCAYALAACWMVRRFAGAPLAASGPGPGVSLLKPLHGNETGLFNNLASFCRQAFSGPFEIIFGVQDPSDPAIDVVDRLRTEFPGVSIHLVVDTAEHGTNRKVSNLINMFPMARHDLIVLSDSDIAVDENYLQRLCDTLTIPGTGLVTCLYHGRAVGNLWSRLACMAVALHFLPSVLIGLATGLARPCFGSTIALRRQTLAQIGGFGAFADQIADDYAIGAAVRKLGLGVEIPPFLVGHTFPDQNYADMFRHELRWARTIFSVDRAGFAGSGITHALPFAVIAWASRGFDGSGFLLVLAALICRLALLATVARALRIPDMQLWLVPLRDFISFLVYVACFFSSRVEWRGQDFTLQANGTMVAAASTRNGKAER